MTGTRAVNRTLEHSALGAFALFTVLAVAGYGWFGLDPSRLPQTDLALRVFNASFQLFAQTHIVLAAIVLALGSARTSGWRLLVPFTLVYLLSFLSEHIGTGYGIPFGGYAYTGLLGARVGPRVPALIPLSWFLMALPAWVLAGAAFRSRPGTGLPRATLGAAWLVVWDLALDPAMSALTPYWRWTESGPYYGMPWMNLVGWFATGLVLMGVLAGLDSWARLSAHSRRWMAAYYAVMAAMPLGMLAVAGQWLAVGITLVAAASLWGITRLAGAATTRTRKDPAGAPELA